MKHVTAALFFVWTVGISAVGEARYRPLTFIELSKRAEIVVLGTIANTTGETFAFDVERTIRSRAGVPAPTSGQPLQITKFRNWTCARRWSEYAVGQKAVLFLERREGVWHVLGGGNEGEMPVVGDRIFVDGNVSGGFGEWTIYDARYFGGRLAVEDVLNAVAKGKPLRAHVDGKPDRVSHRL